MKKLSRAAICSGVNCSRRMAAAARVCSVVGCDMGWCDPFGVMGACIWGGRLAQLVVVALAVVVAGAGDVDAVPEDAAQGLALACAVACCGGADDALAAVAVLLGVPAGIAQGIRFGTAHVVVIGQVAAHAYDDVVVAAVRLLVVVLHGFLYGKRTAGRTSRSSGWMAAQWAHRRASSHGRGGG